MIDASLFWQCARCRKSFSIGITTMRVREDGDRLVRVCIECDDEIEDAWRATPCR